jgi:exonuclease SbcD
MKFIHAADIHLDSPLHGLSAYPDAPVERLRGASREALRSLVDKAIEEQVHFLVIAGDLYDGDWRDHNTGIFFSQQMGRLMRARIRVFVVWGNHDAESEMTRQLTLPENVTVFGSREAQSYRLEELGVVLHGRSFGERAVVDNIALHYPPAVSGYYNIGVLHTALEGYVAHASYAPCTRAELHAKGYDYWALGHVHEYQQWEERSTIVFPGNLQGRSVRETGRRGAVLVTVDQGRTQVERLYMDVLRWESVDVDASPFDSMQDLSQGIGLKLEEVLGYDGHVPRAVRVTLVGKTNLHGELLTSKPRLRAEVLNRIGMIGSDRLWLEKVLVATQPAPQVSVAQDEIEALAELRQILAGAATDHELLLQLQQDLQPFVGIVPNALREDVPLLTLVRNGEMAEVIRQIEPSLMARIEREN